MPHHIHAEHTAEKLALAGQYIQHELATGRLQSLLLKAKGENGWFTPEFSQFALRHIAAEYLDGEKLARWLGQYPPVSEPKTIAVVAAGNIPLVSAHDMLAVLCSGHRLQLKLSSKDTVLARWLLETLLRHVPEWQGRAEVVEKLQGFDAVIATGSNNTNRYFEYYFGKYPHLLRKGRSSVAVVSCQESVEELQGLGRDVFTYFGLGCRSASMVWLPVGYDIGKLYRAWEPFSFVAENQKYVNNYDYNKSILLLNKEPHLDNGFLLLRESTQLASPVASLHYQFYQNLDEVSHYLAQHHQEVQAVYACQLPLPAAEPLGKGQTPPLDAYADGKDTMAFLTSL